MDKKKILIVDDEPNIRVLVSSILDKEYIVLQANDGEEAVNTVRQKKPHLILMDIMMPKMDGYTACTQIRMSPETRNIPVVILTGVNHELNRKFAEEIGADGYITKPFSSEELHNVVRRLL